MKQKLLIGAMVLFLLACGIINQARCVSSCWRAYDKDACYAMCIDYVSH